MTLSVQRESLQNLQVDISVLNEEQRQFIGEYYNNTGIKSEVVFWLIDLKQQLSERFNSDLKKTFTNLQLDFKKYVNSRLHELPQTDEELTEMAQARFELDDVLFSCSEIATYHLTQYNQAQSQSVGTFRAERLPTILNLCQLVKSKDIQTCFENIQNALQGKDWQDVQANIKRIQELLKM